MRERAISSTFRLSWQRVRGFSIGIWLRQGRASGETFAYPHVGLALQLCAAGELVALERMELEPALRPLTSPLRWGQYRYMATLYVSRGCGRGRLGHAGERVGPRWHKHTLCTMRPAPTQQCGVLAPLLPHMGWWSCAAWASVVAS